MQKLLYITYLHYNELMIIANNHRRLVDSVAELRGNRLSGKHFEVKISNGSGNRDPQIDNM